MSRNRQSQGNVAGTPRIADGSSSHPPIDPKWEQLVLELRASSVNTLQDLDEIAAARYLSGGCTEAEREQLQEILGDSPSLTEGIALARQVLTDMESAA